MIVIKEKEKKKRPQVTPSERLLVSIGRSALKEITRQNGQLEEVVKVLTEKLQAETFRDDRKRSFSCTVHRDKRGLISSIDIQEK